MMRSFPLIAALALLTSGCATSPQPKYYTLSARAPQERLQAAPVNIAIDRVIVPDMVDRPQFVIRIDATQVEIDDYARWAEPLKGQIARVLAANLAQSVPGALVSGYQPWAAEAKAYRVAVDVQTFESARGNMATIAVLWTVRPPNAGEAVSKRTIVHEAVSGQSYDAIVDAHSQALAAVSADIAGAIRATLRP
jgi:uncharacterized lipoprotein YmbA